MRDMDSDNEMSDDTLRDALLRILTQTENALKPSLMYVRGELEQQILHILLETLPEEQDRIQAALKESED